MPPSGSGDAVPEPLLDPEAIAELRGLDDSGDSLRALVSLFLEHAPARVTQLEEALVSSDRETARMAAHSLRGSAATFGARELAALAGQVEAAAREGRDPASEVVSRVREVLDEVTDALAAMVDGPLD